jgi:hypothetical protein
VQASGAAEGEFRNPGTPLGRGIGCSIFSRHSRLVSPGSGHALNDRDFPLEKQKSSIVYRPSSIVHCIQKAGTVFLRAGF